MRSYGKSLLYVCDYSPWVIFLSKQSVIFILNQERGSDKIAPLIITNLNLSKFWLTRYHLPGIGFYLKSTIFTRTFEWVESLEFVFC